MRWSPGGSSLVYVRQEASGGGEVWAADPEEAASRPLAEGVQGRIELLFFSSDLQLIAFLAEDERGRELWAADMSLGGAKRLVTQADLRLDETGVEATAAWPAEVGWVPGAHRLTFVPVLVYGGGDWAQFLEPVYSVDADTGEISVLFPQGEGGHISYAPNGGFMVIADEEDLRLAIIEEADDPQPLFQYARICGIPECFLPRPFWIPGLDRFLLALHQEGLPPDQLEPGMDVPVTVWEVSAIGGGKKEVGEFFGAPDLFNFSPDAKWVAYHQADGGWGLRISDVGGERDLLYDSGPEREFHGWAPDSRRFAYSSWFGQVKVGDRCGASLSMTDLPDAQFVGWLSASRFLFAAGHEGERGLYLGTMSNESIMTVELGPGQLFDYALLDD